MGLFRRDRPPRSAVVPPVPVAAPEPDRPATDDAWRMLQLVVEWIKHADTKAAATLASSGVLGGLLYALVSNAKKPGAAFAVCAVACAVAITCAAVGAGSALRPRLRDRRAAAGLVFYRSIAAGFPDDVDGYVRQFASLTADRTALLDALSAQIWSNAMVATRKYRAVNVALTSLLVAAGMLGVTALLGLLSR